LLVSLSPARYNRLAPAAEAASKSRHPTPVEPTPMLSAHFARRGFLAALASLPLLTTFAAAQESAAPRPLKVMTYNVRYASDEGPNAWPDRMPVAVEMLAAQAPDVIGMQEATYRQVKDYETNLPDYDWIGLGRDGGSRGEFMAVFYRAERLEPLEFDHFWLSDEPDRIGSSTWGNSNRRMVTWVRFRDRASDQEFFFFNTHFDHQIQPAREKSADLLWNRIDALNTELPIIVTGDFNAQAEKNPAYKTLVAPDRLTDTWVSAEKHGPLVATFHGYGEPQVNGTRIDWILTRGPVKCVNTEIVTFEKNNQYPSDHFPVMAELQLESK
jgi:endonuclease/exonuclease/phosphatase family metal-dependent hydrolase